MQPKFGDEAVGKVQLRQHFDITAGVNSNRAEVLGQRVGHQIVRSGDQTRIIDIDGTVEIKRDVVDIFVWDVFNDQNVCAQDTSSKHQETIHVFAFDIDVTTKEGAVSRQIHQATDIPCSVDLGIGSNDKTSFSGCHKRTRGSSLIGDIHRATRGQLQERAGVQRNQSSIRGKIAIEDHHRPVGFNGLSFNHASEDDSAAHG